MRLLLGRHLSFGDAVVDFDPGVEDAGVLEVKRGGAQVQAAFFQGVVVTIEAVVLQQRQEGALQLAGVVVDVVNDVVVDLTTKADATSNAGDDSSVHNNNGTSRE